MRLMRELDTMGVRQRSSRRLKRRVYTSKVWTWRLCDCREFFDLPPPGPQLSVAHGSVWQTCTFWSMHSWLYWRVSYALASMYTSITYDIDPLLRYYGCMWIQLIVTQKLFSAIILKWLVTWKVLLCSVWMLYYYYTKRVSSDHKNGPWLRKLCSCPATGGLEGEPSWWAIWSS